MRTACLHIKQYGLKAERPQKGGTALLVPDTQISRPQATHRVMWGVFCMVTARLPVYKRG